MFDPRTQVTLTRTITVRQAKNDGCPWGANGNFAKISWAGPANDDMIVYQGVKGVQNRGLFLEKFYLYGNGYQGNPCGVCLKLYAPDGDAGALYKFTLRDIYTAYGTYGIVLQGAVFEGMCENVHAENHRKDGMLMQHTNVAKDNRGIVSNVQLIHPNMSRNLGAGVRSVYSCNAAFGSFVLNADGGIVAPDGLRLGFANNGENTGEAVYVVPSNGYGSNIIYSEGSTDGATHARQFVNGKWVSVGKPQTLPAVPGRGRQRDRQSHCDLRRRGRKSRYPHRQVGRSPGRRASLGRSASCFRLECRLSSSIPWARSRRCETPGSSAAAWCCRRGCGHHRTGRARRRQRPAPEPSGEIPGSIPTSCHPPPAGL